MKENMIELGPNYKNYWLDLIRKEQEHAKRKVIAYHRRAKTFLKKVK